MTGTALHAWRDACRSHAAQAALAEARSLWSLHAQSGLPFSHRWEHVQEVVRLALWLGHRVGADAEIVEAAAWLHDVCKQEPRHAEAGALEAERFLPSTDFPIEKRAAVVEAIRLHEGFYRDAGAPPIQPLEAAVLWDADKLSKLGVQSIAYNAGTPYTAGMTLEQRRDYMDSFARSVLGRTVQSMNTTPARAEAERRYDDMMHALDAWAREAQLGKAAEPAGQGAWEAGEEQA